MSHRLVSITRVLPINAAGAINWRITAVWYVVSHGFILACWNALYWDDWVTYSEGSESVREHFANCARCVLPLRRELESLLIAPGPWLMHTLIFLLWPLCAISIRLILTEIHVFSGRINNLVALTFLFIPAYGARVSLINFQYTWLLFLFLLGTWLTLHQRVTLRVTGVLLLFWSLFVASLQVFIVATVASLIWRRYQTGTRGFSLILPLPICLLLFPFVHRYLLPQFFEGLRVTDGYNEIRPMFLARAVIVAIVLLGPTLILVFRKSRGLTVSSEALLMTLGGGLLALGTFPYMAVGHFPNLSDWVLTFLPDMSDWNSRHQLLQTIGFSVLVVGLIEMLQFRRWRSFVAVLVAFVAVNIATYSGYYLDWLKQSALIEQVQDRSEELAGAEAVIVDDQARDLNARGRSLRSYEWDGILERSLGRSIVTGGEALDYCLSQSPSHRIIISAKSGRLKALLTQSVSLNVIIEEIPLCRR